MGYVYFLRETFTNTIKIGKSGSVADRISALSAQLPFEVKEEFIIKTNFQDQLEYLFHQIFDHKRVKGEWFALSDEDVHLVKSGDYNTLIDRLDASDKESAKNLFEIYFAKQSIHERKKLTRVNVSLDDDIHNKLRQAAYEQEMTKTSLGAEIISIVLADEKLLDQVIHKMCS